MTHWNPFSFLQHEWRHCQTPGTEFLTHRGQCKPVFDGWKNSLCRGTENTKLKVENSLSEQGRWGTWNLAFFDPFLSSCCFLSTSWHHPGKWNSRNGSEHLQEPSPTSSMDHRRWISLLTSSKMTAQPCPPPSWGWDNRGNALPIPWARGNQTPAPGRFILHILVSCRGVGTKIISVSICTRSTDLSHWRWLGVINQNR